MNSPLYVHLGTKFKETIYDLPNYTVPHPGIRKYSYSSPWEPLLPWRRRSGLFRSIAYTRRHISEHLVSISMQKDLTSLLYVHLPNSEKAQNGVGDNERRPVYGAGYTNRRLSTSLFTLQSRAKMRKCIFPILLIVLQPTPHTFIGCKCELQNVLFQITFKQRLIRLTSSQVSRKSMLTDAVHTALQVTVWHAHENRIHRADRRVFWRERWGTKKEQHHVYRPCISRTIH